MATIRKEILIAAPPEQVWDALRDVGAVHTRLAPGFVTDCRMEEGRVRVVTFGNGMVVREPIVSVDDASRRLAYTAEGGRTRHYGASMQVFSDGETGTRAVWLIDLLPDEVAPAVSAMVDAGAAAMKQRLETRE